MHLVIYRMGYYNIRRVLKSSRPSLPLKKAPPFSSIVFATLSVPLVGDRNVALNHFILWLADHQRSTPCGCAGWGIADKVDGALRNLLITFRFSAIFLVISGKRYIFAEKSNV